MAARATERQRWRRFIRSNISARAGVSNSGGPAGEGRSNDLDEAFASLQRRRDVWSILSNQARSSRFRVFGTRTQTIGGPPLSSAFRCAKSSSLEITTAPAARA
jgi:hypothetical protein